MPEGLLPAAAGLATGLRIGLLNREMKLREQEAATQTKEREADRAMRINLGKMDAAFRLMDNKNIPSAMKLNLWNTTVVPSWNSLHTQPGSPVDDSQLLGQMTEWPDALGDHIKSAVKIMGDKNLSIPQKLEGLRTLQVAAGEDIRLAPMIEQLREQHTLQEQQDTARALELIPVVAENPREAPPELISEYIQIKTRSPKALLDAYGEYDRRRKEQREEERLGLERSREKREAAKGEKATKLDAFTDAQGNRIVVMELGGTTQRLNLGKTKEEGRANAAHWRANVATRAAGLQSGDTKIDAWTPQQAKKVLEEFNRSDPFRQALANIIGGVGAPPGTTPPEQEAGEFLKGLGVE